jgi:hypothetical protein
MKPSSVVSVYCVRLIVHVLPWVEARDTAVILARSWWVPSKTARVCLVGESPAADQVVAVLGGLPFLR